MRESCHSLDRLAVTFDDDHAVANAGLILPATLGPASGHESSSSIAHVDLGDAPGRANVGHKGDDLGALGVGWRGLHRRR